VIQLYGIPRKLHDQNLRALGDETEDFLNDLGEFRNKGSRLQEKLKKVGEDYRSELSALKSEYSKVKKLFDDLWVSFRKTGKDIGGKYKALKETCTRGCLP
jgi:cell shape-determining protein MreC